MPDHNLKPKLNCLCLVMRDISVHDRVMNNAKVIICEVGRKVVTVETLPKCRQVLLAHIVLLPRSNLTGTEAVPREGGQLMQYDLLMMVLVVSLVTPVNALILVGVQRVLPYWTSLTLINLYFQSRHHVTQICH